MLFSKVKLTYVYLFFAVAIAGYALTYYWHVDNPFSARFHQFNQVGVYSHFMGAGFALLLGALQFFTSAGSKLHRRLGYSYCIAVVIGALGGCYLSLHSHLGLQTGIGFFIADVLWICFLALGIKRARDGKIRAHSRWMIRCMALTTAGITLRIWLPLLCLFFSFDTSYLMVAWLSWIPNLIAVEIYFYLSSTRSTNKKSSINHLAKGN